MTRFDPTYRGNHIRRCLQVLLFLALGCGFRVAFADGPRPDRDSVPVPWDLDTMRLDISKLDMGIEYARDAAIHILAWRRTLLTHSNYPADTLWTALVLASYRTRDWISHPSDTIDSWALMLVSREPHRRYRDGHWFFYARGSFHGPPVSYSVMHHAPTIQDLDSLLDRAYTPFFTGEYTLRPGLRSGVRDSILEGHIMTEAWEEVFGEPPTYRFDLPPPRKE